MATQTNPQGLTALQMVDPGVSKTIDDALANPGQLMTGPTVGQTGGGLPSVPIQFQALTNVPNGQQSTPPPTPTPSTGIAPPPVNLPGVVEGKPIGETQTQPKTQTNTLSSQPADSFLSKANETLDQQEANAKQDAEDRQKALEEQQAAAQKAVQAEYANKRQQLGEMQAEERKTLGALEFRLGRSDTLYGAKEVEDQQVRFQRQMNELAMDEQRLISQTRVALMQGKLDLAKQLKDEADNRFSQRLQLNQESRAQLAQTLEVQKQVDQLRDKSFQEIAEGGKTADQIPDEYFKTMDQKARDAGFETYDGFSRDRFQSFVNETKIKTAKDQSELQQATLDQVSTIQKMMQNQPAGIPLRIANADYFGLKGGATFEKDVAGNGSLMFTDSDGKQKVKNLGFVGDTADLELQYVNGHPMMFNKRTTRFTPITQGAGVDNKDAGWDNLVPDGTVGGQCGAFVHQIVSNYPFGANTVDQKRALVNVDKTDQPKVGDVLLQDYGTTGHAAVVNWAGQLPDGSWQVRLTESNFNGDTKVSNYRNVNLNDSHVMGLFRGDVRQEFQTGADQLPGAGPGLAHPNTIPGGLTAPQEAGSSPFTTGVMDAKSYVAGQQKEQQAQTAAKGVVSGDSLKDVPIELRARTMELARSQGWKPPEEASLDSATDQDKLLAKKIAAYDVNPTVASSRTGRQEYLVALASKLDPSYDQSEYSNRSRLKLSFKSGPDSNAIQSYNTVIGHIGNLKTTSDALASKNLKKYNSIEQAIKGELGSKALGAYKADQEAVANELMKAFRTSGVGSETEVQRWNSIFDPAAAPDTLNGAINEGLSLLASRVGASRFKYTSGMGGQEPNFSFLSPKALETLTKMGVTDPELVGGQKGDLASQAKAKGFDYDKMKANNYSDDEIKAFLDQKK